MSWSCLFWFFRLFLVRHILFICILITNMVLFFSGLYSCALGYVREFLLLILHWFPLNLVILLFFGWRMGFLV
jgi:hypothetical protein